MGVIYENNFALVTMKKSLRVYLITFAAISALISTYSFGLSASLVNVPLDHWSYRFIDRLQTKGILKDYLINSKPYSRVKVAKMVLHVLFLLEDGKVRLTNTEMELIEELKKEFAKELADLGYPVAQKYKHLLDWADGDKILVAEIALAQDTSFDMSDLAYTSTLSMRLYGDIWRNVSFYNYSKASYSSGKEPPLLKRSDPRYIWRYPWSALSDAYFTFGNPQINIQVGKDSVLWGTGYHGVLGLSGVESTFDMVRFNTKIWKIDFTSLLGFLRDDLTKKYQSDVPSKYISAHRLEMIPYPGISVAWQEAYVYAEKLYMELLNPIMPYQMAEDYLGEIGNNTMEGDMEVSLIPNTDLYASLFLDDFHPDKNPFTYPGFRWAVLGGLMITDPFGIDDTDVVLEYARVEPWTYAHRGTYQNPPIPTAYKHFDESLGHWIGPNAEDLFAQIGWQFNKNIHADLSYNRIRHGEIGGSMYDALKPLEEKKKFLDGIVEVKKITKLALEYTFFNRLEVATYYKYTKIKNRQREEAKLPESDEDKQDWKTGWNTEESEFCFAVQFRY